MNTALLRRMLEEEEGRRTKAYRDSLGVWTVGVGFNLQAADADQILHQVGAPSFAALRGGAELSDEQVDALLEITMRGAIASAATVVGQQHWNELPEAVQILVADLAFNMGPTRLAGFQQMLMALRRHDWAAAARELEDSLWFRQVGHRGPKLVAALAAGGLTEGVA